MHDLPLPDFAAQLHLRRHKFDCMFLQVDDREEDHDFFAMVDNLTYAGFQDLGAWRHDPRLLADIAYQVGRTQMRAPRLCPM